MVLITTVQDADAYFETRLNSGAWTALAESPSGGMQKTAALSMAQRALSASYLLNAEDEQHLFAVYEQALFEAAFAASRDRRAALAAMGVIEAGIVEEKYTQGAIYLVPFAVQALTGSERAASGGVFFTGRLTRDDSVA